MFLLPVPQSPPVRISVDAAKPLVTVPRELFGVFFEEINRAGEGGVLAEKIENPTLLGAPDPKTGLPEGWSAVAGLLMGQAPSEVTRVPAKTELATFGSATPGKNAPARALRIGVGSVQLLNDGFGGIAVNEGERYALTLLARSDAPISARLYPGTPREGRFPRSVLAELPSTGGEWRRITTTLVAGETDARASLLLSVGDGALEIGYVSLTPERTWKGHGLRPDLAQKVAAMEPGFFRFPGGCYVEGNSLANAFDWKATLGPPEARRGTDRIFWGYPSSNGLGYHEYLQFCEDLGARAMYVANAGLSHSDMASLDGGMKRYVQDALDAIEYANGPVTSTW